MVGSSPVGNHGTSPTVGLTNLVQAGLGGAGVHPVDAQVVRDHAPGTIHLESASRVLQRVDSIRRLNYDYRTLQSRTVWSFLQLLGSNSRHIWVKRGHVDNIVPKEGKKGKNRNGSGLQIYCTKSFLKADYFKKL